MDPVASAEALFLEAYAHPPAAIAFAPGRVNIIGEHTDYQNGLSMPGALNLGTAVALSAHVEHPGMVTSANTPDGWKRYVESALQECGLDPTGCAVAAATGLPIGAGLSSSAALIVATLLAAESPTHQASSRIALAETARRAEHHAVGVPCGLLDPIAVLYGQPGHVLLLDFQKADRPEPLPWPENCSIALFDSGVRHNLANSAYADRVATLRRVAAHYGAPDLRSVTSFNPAQHPLTDAKRAKHFFSECARVTQFAEALREGDHRAMGALLTGSHRSLQYDYEVSCPEADALVEHLLGSPGCLGARMVGGGFGGMILGLFSGPTTLQGALSVKLAEGARLIHQR